MNKILQGEALAVLKTLDTASVDMLVTSPPYYGLRDYGIDEQLGLESSVKEYIDKLLAIFVEAKRVVKHTGTFWINIGDTYSDTRWSGNGKGQHINKMNDGHRDINPIKGSNAPHKSLIGIPFMFALGMIDNGFALRNTIIWQKPSCMPSSAKDRFTIDYEYLFFFAAEKNYYFEQQVEPSVSINDPRFRNGRHTYNKKYNGETGTQQAFAVINETRNKRCVWSINPARYKEAHFAVFPEELIWTPIKAGCPIGGIVLDPFMGSGTSAIVALKQNKQYLGIELNPEYIELANSRIEQYQKQTKIDFLGGR